MGILRKPHLIRFLESPHDVELTFLKLLWCEIFVVRNSRVQRVYMSGNGLETNPMSVSLMSLTLVSIVDFLETVNGVL